MLTACCWHKCKHGRPYIHNKHVIVCNLCLLVARIPEVIIDNYGSLKDWFKEVSHKGYCMQLVQCLLDCQTALPARPTEWPPPCQHSPCEHTSFAPAADTPEGDTNSSDRGYGTALPPPLSPPCRCLPPPPPPWHCPPGHIVVLSMLLNRWTKNKEWCFLHKWRQHTLKDSLFEHYELSLRQTNEVSTNGSENVYRVGSYVISYVWGRVSRCQCWRLSKIQRPVLELTYRMPVELDPSLNSSPYTPIQVH